jgi:hypothetical protein
VKDMAVRFRATLRTPEKNCSAGCDSASFSSVIGLMEMDESTSNYAFAL